MLLWLSKAYNFPSLVTACEAEPTSELRPVELAINDEDDLGLSFTELFDMACLRK
jgi:hypothetical protein